MITFDQARAIALAEIARAKPKYNFVLVDEETLTRPLGWVFVYTTPKYLETGDIMDSIPGTAPFMIDRRDGKVHELDSSGTFEHSLAELERELGSVDSEGQR